MTCEGFAVSEKELLEFGKELWGSCDDRFEDDDYLDAIDGSSEDGYESPDSFGSPRSMIEKPCVYPIHTELAPPFRLVCFNLGPGRHRILKAKERRAILQKVVEATVPSLFLLQECNQEANMKFKNCFRNFQTQVYDFISARDNDLKIVYDSRVFDHRQVPKRFIIQAGRAIGLPSKSNREKLISRCLFARLDTQSGCPSFIACSHHGNLHATPYDGLQLLRFCVALHRVSGLDVVLAGDFNASFRDIRLPIHEGRWVETYGPLKDLIPAEPSTQRCPCDAPYVNIQSYKPGPLRANGKKMIDWVVSIGCQLDLGPVVADQCRFLKNAQFDHDPLVTCIILKD